MMCKDTKKEVNSKILSEEFQRMRILSGVNENPEVLEEGLLANIAGTLGITLMALTNALGQDYMDYINKLKYPQKEKEILMKAMEDSVIIKKLEDKGVPDNNIIKAIENLKGKKGEKFIRTTADTEEELDSLLSKGYHLVHSEVVKLIEKTKEVAPDSIISKVELFFNDDAFFESGKFELNQNEISQIINLLTHIQENKDVLINISIESSTDKQGLSIGLQKRLQDMKYEPNNFGLSRARNCAVLKTLKSYGIDDSIIHTNILHNQGPDFKIGTDSKITEYTSHRYVKTTFDVLNIEKKLKTTEPEMNSKEIVKYNLIKPMKKDRSWNWKLKIPILKFGIPKIAKPDKCPSF